ncbi:MAG: ferrous iron transporter B, partial [Beggiatoa sp. IS2]
MKRIVLLGMPNTGKSTLFNRLTGAMARVGNWPGMTVDFMSAKVLLGTEMVELVDLPGIYDLPGASEDEHVVQQFLETMPVDLILVVTNTTQIERQLALVLQIKHFQLPIVVLLNMADEAHHYGIRVDTQKMSTSLNAPVVLLSAKQGRGYTEALATITQTIRQLTKKTKPIDTQNLVLSNTQLIDNEVETILQNAVHIPAQLPDHLTRRLDRLFLHPWLGLPLFFLIMSLLFQAIFWLGAPLQEEVAWLLEQFKEHILLTLTASFPVFIQGLLVDGIYDGAGTVASFVPIIVLFFVFMTIVEDSGYLSRAAFLMDAFMAKLGLDGRSFVMMLMG